jgi:hypothetical protein
MRINILYLFSLVCLLLFVSSCEEKKTETEIIKKEPVKETKLFSYKLPQKSFNDLKVKRGILVFENKKHLTKTINKLKKEEEEYQKKFRLYYKNLSTKEKEKKVHKTNYSPHKVLEKFEDFFNINTLRQKIYKEETEWLRSKKLDFSEDPNDDYFVISKYMRTVLNKRGEIIIGNSICKIMKSGKGYEIKNRDFELLKKIRNDQLTDKMENANLVIHLPNDDQKSGGRKNEKRTDVDRNGNKKVKKVIAIRNVFWGSHYVVAKTKAYIKRSAWFATWWGRRYTTVNASARGTVYDAGATPKDVNADDSDDDGKAKAKDHFGNTMWARDGSVYGWHNCNSFDDSYLYLNF